MTTGLLVMAFSGLLAVVALILVVRALTGRSSATGSATRKSHDPRVTLGADGFTFTDAYLTEGTEIVYEADRANGMTRGTFLMSKSPVWVYIGNTPLAVRLLPGRLPDLDDTPSARGVGGDAGDAGWGSTRFRDSDRTVEPLWRHGGMERRVERGGGDDSNSDSNSDSNDAPYQGGGGESGGGGSTDSWGSEDSTGSTGDFPSAY